MTIPHGKIRVLLLAGILAAFQRGAIVWAFGPANHRLIFTMLPLHYILPRHHINIG